MAWSTGWGWGSGGERDGPLLIYVLDLPGCCSFGETAADVEEALWLLEQTRRDLLAALDGVPEEALTRLVPGQKFGSISGVLEHVAEAERFYLSRLDRGVLPGLAGDGRVVERRGELWSARKVVRRALWHECDHTGHVAKLLRAYGPAPGVSLPAGGGEGGRGGPQPAPDRPSGAGGQSNSSTVRATSPAFMARKASFTSSRRPVRVIISSRRRRPWR